MRALTLALLVAVGCAPDPVSYRTARTPLPPPRSEPVEELSPSGLPATILADLATPERQVLFARNRDGALLATRVCGRWHVGPVRLDRKGGLVLSPADGSGALRPIQEASEQGPAALERSGAGYVLVWVETGSSGEATVESLRLDTDGKPTGKVQVLGKSAVPVEWVDVLADDDLTFVLWDAPRGANKDVALVALTNDGVTAPATIEAGRAWHTVAGTGGLWFASTSGSGTSGRIDAARVTVEQRRIAVKRLTLRESVAALDDVQLAPLAGGRALAAWTERQQGDLRVVVAPLSPDASSGPAVTVDKLGGQALVGLTASGDGAQAMLAWERERDAQSTVRTVELATVKPDGRVAPARAELTYQAPTELPRLIPDGVGFAALTLAPMRLTTTSTEDALVVPTFVRFDGELRVRSSEPIRVAELPGEGPRRGVPALAHSPACAKDRCTLVARGDTIPSVLVLVEVPARNHGWVPAARHRPPAEPPLAEELRTVAELDGPVADLAAAELADGRTLLAWVEEPPAGSSEGAPGRLRYRWLGADGRPGETVTLSEKAMPRGGVDVAASPSGTESVATIAWAGPNDGAQVFLTRLGPKGEKLDQRSVTAVPRTVDRGKDARPTSATEVLDVELARDARGDYLVAWSDTRSGDPAIQLARVDAKLERKGKDVRVSSGNGAATEPTLAVLGDRTLVAWSETADGADQGEIHLASLETGSLKVLERAHPLTRSIGHSRSATFASAPEGVVLSWVDEAARGVTPPGEPDEEAPTDDTPGLRLLALDRDGRPLNQLLRVPVEAQATSSVALRCDDGACRTVLATLDGGELLLEGLASAFGGAAPPLRRPLLALPGSRPHDVHLELSPHAGRAYFAQRREGRTFVRELKLRWMR